MRITILLASCLMWGCMTSPEPTAVRAMDAEPPKVVEAPDWQIGDEWTYRQRIGLSEALFVQRVVEAGDGGYVRVRTGAQTEDRYYTPKFELLARARGGVVFQQFNPPLPTVKFPLRVGLKWSQGDPVSLAAPEAPGGT